MPRFRIIVHGRMMAATTEAGPCPRGFYTAWCVEAPSEIEAGQTAIRGVQNDPRIGSLQVEWASPPPDLEIDETVRLGPTDAFDLGPTGLILYDESRQVDSE